MRLILARHGQTSSNVDHLLDTAVPGADLTPLGRDQSEALAEALESEPIDLIVTSTLVRTQQTAEPLAAALGLKAWVRDGAREISAGVYEMRGDGEAVRGYLELMVAWLEDLDTRLPDGESGNEFYARYDAVIEEVAASGAETAVVISHGAAIRCWVAGRATNIGPEFTTSHELNNTGVVVLDGDPERGWTVLTWEGEPVGGAEMQGAPGPAGETARV